MTVTIDKRPSTMSRDELLDELFNHYYEELLKEFALNEIPTITVTVTGQGETETVEVDFYEDLLEVFCTGEVLNDYKELYACCLRKNADI